MIKDKTSTPTANQNLPSFSTVTKVTNKQDVYRHTTQLVPSNIQTGSFFRNLDSV